MQLNDIYPVAAIVLGCIGYFLWTMLPDLWAMLFGKPKTSIFPKGTHKAGFTTNAGAMGGTSENLDEYKAFKLTEAEYTLIKSQPK